MPARRLLLAPILLLAAAPGGDLVVDVGNVRNASGRVHVDVCPQSTFLKDCPYSAEAPARAGVTEVVVPGVPAGRYAVQATHDENGNGKVDRGLFGIPKEGVAFSRTSVRFRAPRWDEAVFGFDGHAGRVSAKLRYFLGPSGPARR